MVNRIKTKRYLAVITLMSFGVLSGCEYCIPLLAVSLAIPVMNNITNRLDLFLRTTSLEGDAS